MTTIAGENLDEPMFFGEYDHALDAQGRFSFPKDWRRADGEGVFVLLPARGKALVLLPSAIFRDFVNRTKKLAIANPKLQMAFAQLGSQARQCRCDKQGRMALEKKMLESIGVSGQLKLIGALNHIRLVAPENWVMPDSDELDSQLDAIQQLSEESGDIAALLRGIVGQ